MVITYQVVGGARLARELATLRSRVSRSIQYKALFAGAEPMRSAMSTLAPYDPESKLHLRDHIIVRRAVDELRAAAVAIGPLKKTFWGGFQEWGTAHHGAQPFARPAFDQTVHQTINVIKATLADQLIRAGTGLSGRAAGGGIGETFTQGSGTTPVSGGPGAGGLL